MKIRNLFVLIALNIYLLASNSIEESIVKIYTVSKIPSYTTPWNSSIKRSHGSGSIISGNRILTNAHVVADETFIEVKRHGDTTKYEAEVEYISHQADLALLKLKDETFFKGTKSLELDGLPKFEQDIAVYGFPVGGDSLSVSRGIVSRIEHNRYAHSREIFLSIQIDAAVNPGSSGGPAISDGKIVGVVMQQIAKRQNIGYIVPVEIVRHFLDDVKDGKYDGFAHIGITTQMMESKALRTIYKMDEKMTGALIIDISKKSNAYGRLKKDDILLSIDGHNVQNDATVEFIHNKYTSYKYYIVILLKVLASPSNRGDHNFYLWKIDKVNGVEFKNFAEFVKVLEEFKGKYLIIENEDGVKIAIDRDEAIKSEQTILKRYSIKNSQRL